MIFLYTLLVLIVLLLVFIFSQQISMNLEESFPWWLLIVFVSTSVVGGSIYWLLQYIKL